MREEEKPPSSWKRLVFTKDWKGRVSVVLLVLPYILGIIWTSLHTNYSILTGESKCRGWYIDEHSILLKYPQLGSNVVPTHLQQLLPPSSQTETQSNKNNNHLCTILGDTNSKSNVDCYIHSNTLEVVTIVPLANAIEPVEETIVLVVDSATTSSPTFYRAIAASIQKLADPVRTPWLAKTIMIVSSSALPRASSSSSNTENDYKRSLEDTVEYFLDAYYGTSSSSGVVTSKIPPFPPHLCKGIIRNVIAIQVDYDADNYDSESYHTDFRVLPQGKRGVLPNADLVFMMGRLFTNSQFLSGWNKRSTQRNTRSKQNSKFISFATHAYPEEARAFKNYVDTRLSRQLIKKYGIESKYVNLISTWLQDMSDLVFFCVTAVKGPFPPHAQALDRGIDAITITANFAGKSNFDRDPVVETVEYIEYLVHALSGLHEQLHHSFTLYWMPSPTKFVSHIEYLLPIVLLLLPNAIRAFGLVFVEMTPQPLHLETIGMSILITVLGTISTGLVLNSSLAISYENTTYWWPFLYAIIMIVFYSWFRGKMQKSKNEEKGDDDDNGSSSSSSCAPNQIRRIVQTLQFVACSMAVYALVPMAFAHGALAYPVCLMWTPLLAFPNYYSPFARRPLHLLWLVLVLFPLLIVTLPPILMVPRMFADYTVFVKFVYVPFHIQFFLLALGSTLQALYK